MFSLRSSACSATSAVKLFPVRLSPGRRLGPYEILTAIGAGGMGEVYKARDTRLDRVVAIKNRAGGRIASGTAVDTISFR